MGGQQLRRERSARGPERGRRRCRRSWGAGQPNNPTDPFGFGQSTVPAGLNGVVAVAAGTWNSVALVGGPVLTPPAPQPGGPVQAHPERNSRMALHGQRLDRPGELDALDELRGDQRLHADCRPGSGRLQPPVLSGDGAVGRRSKAPSSEIRRKSEIRNPKSDGRVAHGISVQNGPLSGHEHESGDVFVLMTTKANSMFHGPRAVAHPPRRQSSARSAMSIVQRVAWAKLRQERHIRIARSRGQRAAPDGA